MAQSARPPLGIGFLLMPTEFSAAGRPPTWREMLAMVRRAEELGYDSVWIPDHLIIDIPRPGSIPEGAWEAWSLVSAIAAVTERIGIGLLVSCTAFRNPALLAKMADTVDEISGGRFGINIVGRSKRLTLNYRTTDQNLRYALGILSGEQFVDLNEEAVSSDGYRSARSGPKPFVVQCESLSALYERAAGFVKEWGDAVGPVGLLVSTRNEGERLPRVLAEYGAEVRFVDRDGQAASGKAAVMTMHRSKGMEFSRVILVGVGKDSLPSEYRLKSLPEAERADALRRERSLLYVAATRARDVLVVLHTGAPSELLPDTGAPSVG